MTTGSRQDPRRGFRRRHDAPSGEATPRGAIDALSGAISARKSRIRSAVERESIPNAALSGHTRVIAVSRTRARDETEHFEPAIITQLARPAREQSESRMLRARCAKASLPGTANVVFVAPGPPADVIDNRVVLHAYGAALVAAHAAADLAAAQLVTGGAGLVRDALGKPCA